MTPKQHPIYNMTLEEIGQRFGISKERVRQIEKVAIGKIRIGLELEGIDSIQAVRELIDNETPSETRVVLRDFDRTLEHEAAA